MINNAGGYGAIGPVEWNKTEDLLQTINLNLCGVIRVTNALIPLLKRGDLIVVSVFYR